ncbi:hypothetical protein IQ273_07595 [Nodosilinea sp. LEGE 07298]|uniref:hypothetical protein n=1 Tax=Nodosilinea sp. LEGE 07298 TaxID=2777970 RepID=UPI001881D50A|nr:hypothetical protein [Nodosilinea sp. LEGE 07298]MBE9109277.1 hypothetical protein [Nodosilinea sp. LEGE 07298]
MTSPCIALNPDCTNDKNGEIPLAYSLPLNAPATDTPSAFKQRWNLSTLFSVTFRQRLKKLTPWLISGSVLSLELILHQPAFMLGVSLFGLASMTVKALLRSNPAVQKLFKRVGLSAQSLPVLSIAFGGGVWLSAATPSQALFFQAAEQFFTTQFPDAAAAIPIVFAVLRALFVLYIGVSLIRVINSVRNDDDWVRAVA